MFCGNCGAQVPDGVKFCHICGAKLPYVAVESPQAPTPAPVTAAPRPQATVEDIPAAEAPQPQATVEDAPGAETPSVDAPAQGKRKQGNGAVVTVLILCALLVTAIVAASVLLVTHLFRGNSARPFVYLDKNGRLQYMADIEEGTRPQSLGSIDAALVLFSDDGKELCISDFDDNLYAISAADIQEGAKPRRVSKDVASWYDCELVNGKLFYTKEERGVDVLYCYDGETSVALADDVYLFYSSEDKKNIYYTQWEGDNRSLYKVATKDGARPQMLAEDIAYMLVDYTADTLLFARDAASRADDLFDIYTCAPGGEPRLLLKDVCDVVDVADDAGDFYYIRTSQMGSAVQGFYDIYHYTGDPDTPAVATRVTNICSSGIPGILLYQKPNSSWCVLVDDVESQPDLGTTSDDLRCYAMSDSEIVFKMTSAGKTQLESWIVHSNGIRYADTLAQSTDGIVVTLWPESDDGDAVLYFFTDVPDTDSLSLAPLFCYQDGTLTQLADNAACAEVFPNSGLAIVTANRNRNWEYELMQVDRKGHAKGISDAARGYAFDIIDENTLLYLDSNDDLYCWDGESSYRVARNVDRAWTFAPDLNSRYISPNYAY